MDSYSVLIVDPDAATRDTIKKILSAIVPDIRTSAHSLEAMTELAARRADLVISALQLPGRDGRWLAEQLERHHRRTRVVLCLPDAQPVYGLDHFANLAGTHAKPIRGSELLNTVRRLMPGTIGMNLSRRDERRRAERVALDATIAISVKLRGAQDCRLIDLSTCGAQLETTTRLVPGRLMELQLGHNGRWQTMMVSVTRCWVASVSAEQVVYRAGLAFDRTAFDVLEGLAGALAA